MVYQISARAVAGQAVIWQGNDTLGVGVAVTSLASYGNSQATALPVFNGDNVVTTVPAGTGVVLPSHGVTTIFNRGLSALLVYPTVGGQIEAFGTNNPASIAVGESATFVQFNGIQWYIK